MLEESATSAISIARVHLWLGVVAEGEGNRTEQLKQLDAAAAEIKDIGPKVVFGAIIGDRDTRVQTQRRKQKELRN